jgi:two-component system, NtrC family, nitrogen regulation sensor histidine kinase NtrY
MIWRRFEFNVTLRVALMTASAMLLGILLVSTGYPVTSFLVAVSILLQVGGLLRRVTTTNRELARFLTVVAHADFSQGFSMPGQGSAFDELGQAFTSVADRFRKARAETERQADYLNAVLEQVPVALAALFPDGRVELLNNAARRMLGHDIRALRLSDGTEMAEALRTLRPGDRRLLPVQGGVGPQQLTVSATQLILGGESRLLMSLQNIATDLEATEVRAWQDLVRVLTHEMMNSLTPVSSLTRTAQVLLQDLQGRLGDRPDVAEDMQDAGQAIDTVARRSDGLLRFVERYRQFTQVPRPELQRLRLQEVLDRMQRLMAPAMAEKRVRFQAAVQPAGLELSADLDLLDQVLINLLKNALEAVGGRTDACITLTAGLDEASHVVISVADNGPGIPAEIAERIFVPFYTTRRDGSGVGLSLARQIMLAHGGSIALANPQAETGGASFRLRF